MSDTTYNGWTNYATWRVNLEIVDDLLSSLVDDEQTFSDIYSLSAYIREVTEDHVRGEDDQERNLSTQYAMAFLDQVNWDEIARHNEELIASEDEDAA